MRQKQTQRLIRSVRDGARALPALTASPGSARRIQSRQEDTHWRRRQHDCLRYACQQGMEKVIARSSPWLNPHNMVATSRVPALVTSAPSERARVCARASGMASCVHAPTTTTTTTTTVPTGGRCERLLAERRRMRGAALFASAAERGSGENLLGVGILGWGNRCASTGEETRRASEKSGKGRCEYGGRGPSGEGQRTTPPTRVR